MTQRTKTIGDLRRRVGETARSMLFERAETGLGRGHALAFEGAQAWLEVHQLEQVPGVFDAIERWKRAGFWVAGFLGYECGYHWQPRVTPSVRTGNGLPLAAFGVYRAPVTAEFRLGESSSAGAVRLEPSVSREAYREQFQEVQRWIAAGHIYQANLTFEVETPYRGSAAQLWAHMAWSQPSLYGAMLRLGDTTILSSSPELFFACKGREIVTRPMKGTARRGRDMAEDDEFARALAADEKNRAENVMIVDLLRNDLGRVAATGSVRTDKLFAVERHPSLLQMTSEVSATLRAEVGLYELFGALFPSGSIVGAPKLRSMQILRDLERRERAVYTGAIGYITPQDEAVFSVAIRTAVLRGERVTMGVGSGVTAGSEANAEYDESLLKAKFLEQPPFALIETVRWDESGCVLIKEHLDRLEASAKHFGFVFDREAVRRKMDEAGQKLGKGAWKLRTLLSADGGTTMEASPIPEESTGKLTAMLWTEPVDSGDLWLRHKTTRRGVYDRAYQAALEAGHADAIFSNEHGCVTEGAVHSVFVRHGDRWRTPPMSAGILPGVYRRWLLEQRPEIREENISVDELASADEIWLTNALRGMRRVTLAS